MWVEAAAAAVEEMVLVAKVELEGPAAVLERVTVFALSGEVKVTGGLVPGMGGVVVLIVPDAHQRLKVGDVQSTRESGSMIAGFLKRRLAVKVQLGEACIEAVRPPGMFGFEKERLVRGSAWAEQ